MRLPHRLRQNVTQRHFMPFGVELGALVLEHRDDTADGVFPDLTLGFHLAAKAAKFGDGTGFARAELDPSVRYQIEAGNAFGYPLRRIGGQLDNAMTQSNVFGAL